MSVAQRNAKAANALRRAAQASEAAAARAQVRQRRGKEVRYWGERHRIVFVSALTGGSSVEVLAGAGGAPTPTEGYAKWLEVPRPQRNAITVLEGYASTTLSVPVTFAAVKYLVSPEEGEYVRVGSPEAVEEEIESLEAMAGLLEGPKGSLELLSVYTADGKGNQIPLMPPGPRKHVEWANTYWVIADIEWDTKPERETRGYRIRQDATVILKEWSPPRGGRTELEATRKAYEELKPKTFTTTAAINTVKRIAAHYHHPYPSAWQEILKANRRNKVIGTSATKHLPVGTKVIVPPLIADSGIR